MIGNWFFVWRVSFWNGLFVCKVIGVINLVVEFWNMRFRMMRCWMMSCWMMSCWVRRGWVRRSWVMCCCVLRYLLVVCLVRMYWEVVVGGLVNWFFGCLLLCYFVLSCYVEVSVFVFFLFVFVCWWFLLFGYYFVSGV